MSKVVRSQAPLYQSRSRPIGWSVAFTNPDNTALDLTGSSAAAALSWTTGSIALDVSALDETGIITVSAATSQSVGIPLGRQSKLTVTITDSLSGVMDYVWPVIGEEP